MKTNLFSRNTRILSMLLVLLMLLGTLSMLPVFATESDGETGGDSGETSVEDPDTGEEELLTVSDAIATYLTTEYESREDKLATMKKMLSKGEYDLYCDPYTGEVAVQNTTTGQILLTNPYDVASVNTDTVKANLLSQLSVTFEDIANNGQVRTMNSYTDAAANGQISVKNIKNGIRIEYTLGKESSKKLMPYWIEGSRFEVMILSKITDEYYRNKAISFYTRQDSNAIQQEIDKGNAGYESVLSSMQTNYTCTKSTYSKLGVTPMYDETRTGANGETVYVTHFTNVQGNVEEHEYRMSDNLVIYTVNSDVSSSEKQSNIMEGYVKSYCPDYNYEQRDYDIELTGYTGDEAANATFRMALEYFLTDDGFEVSLPANGIRYDSDAYRLKFITVLPYIGSSSGDFPGYTFVPDGSGAIIRNEDIMMEGSGYAINGRVYGPDFAYHTLDYNGKSEIMRMPVFGVIENTGIPFETGETEIVPAIDPDTGDYIRDLLTGEIIAQKWTVTEDEVETVIDQYGDLVMYRLKDEEGKYVDEDGNKIDIQLEKVTVSGTDTYYVLNADGTRADLTTPIYDYTYEPQGYFAIIEEGAALCTITSNHGGGVTHKYNSAYATVYPESSDTYNLSDAISVGGNAEWTVVSERKYTGLFKIHYILISDYEGSKYEASYVGMAKAYRDYLEANGTLSALTDVGTDIPLYIESFGMIETEDVIATIPVWVDTALTTFDDIKTMYSQLSESGVSNINFRLKGFTSGGTIWAVPPTTVKFEKVIGGNSGYKELLAEAEGKFGIFPEFDFANAWGSSTFDGFSYSNQTVRTIDDRYANKRAYDATYQSFQYVGACAVSPSAYSDMFEKFSKALDKLGYDGISVSTLGTDLNSDFDEDEPYNREDNKEFTIELLNSLSTKYGNLMVDGGNDYSWAYVKHILNASLDSSRYLRASQSIPFMAIVLHGSIYLAGTPTNMEGDIDYEILKIIENGASPYYTLSYQNTAELKENRRLNQYYSVDFKIWFDELVETYSLLNDALKDVQTSQIDDHQYLFGTRFFTDNEQKEYDEEIAEALLIYQTERNAALAKAIKDAVRTGFVLPDGYEFTNDENGDLIVPEGFDMESFEYDAFEDTYVPSVDTTIDDYSIVYERYENGIMFILNYNSFSVTVELNGQTYTIGAYGFVKLAADGTVTLEH
ncbi:MAG: DUF5696 domain-containing protein [Eubacteriales bacterium]